MLSVRVFGESAIPLEFLGTSDSHIAVPLRHWFWGGNMLLELSGGKILTKAGLLILCILSLHIIPHIAGIPWELKILIIAILRLLARMSHHEMCLP